MNRSLIPETELITREKFLNALAETYLLQDAILNSTELSVISVNTEGLIISFNPASEYLLGYTHEELIGKWTPLIFHDWIEIVKHAQESSALLGVYIEPGFESIVAKARISKTADRREWTYVRKDGSRFPVMLSLSGIWNDEGQLTGYLGIASDITEQKKIDVRIRQSESHLKALLRSIDDVAIEINRERIYTNVWTKHDHLLFVEREKYVGKSIYEVLTGPYANLLNLYETAIEKVFETKQPAYIEYEVGGLKPWRSGKISFIDHNSVLILIRDISENKEAEQQIKASEQRFRSLAENLPGVIYLCRNDATFSMLYLNEHIERMTGFTTQEFLSGQINFIQLYHPDDVANVLSKVEEALAQRQSFQLEYRLQHKSGHWIWIKEFGAGVYQNDELILLEGFLSDVTSQKEAEEEIAKISDEYNRVFNYSISLSAIAGFDGYFKRVNPAWEKALGYSMHELTEIPFADFVHPDDVQATLAATATLNKGNDLATFENRYRCKDGSYRWLLWTSSSDVARQLIYASAIDITELKNTEEQIARVVDENHHIFENSITLSIIADMDGRFKKINPTIKQILGWSESEFLGKTALDFLHPDSIEKTKEAMTLQANGITVFNHENRFLCKDGSYRWLLWSSYADTKHQLLYGTAIDITERKDAEEKLLLSKVNLETAAEELQEQNKQLNSFAHVISHNLRSPVGNITALISLLDEKSTINDYQEIFERLKLTAGSMSETLNDLMDTLKVKKSSSIDLTVLRFSTVLKKVMQDLAGEIIRSNANISSDFSECEEINYNKPYLESIFLNLLSNTLKYRAPKRPLQVKFTTVREGDHILLKVTDNGLGIDLQLHGSKLFGLRKTFHDHKDAKGVGLFLTKTQVEALGGKIWIESTVDKGTTVAVQF